MKWTAWLGAGLITLALPVSARATALESTHALLAGLSRTGRAEALLSWSVPGPPGSLSQSMSGTLALEPPELARLDVRGTGERITIRNEGGEWLQPALKQFVRLTPRHSVAAMRWWRLLGSGTGATERKLAPRRFRLTIEGTPSASADSADVWLDARGLPSRLELFDGMGGKQVYRLAAWRFAKPKGAASFTQVPPPGVEVVEMP
jgi:outer membrane lipoprotein-sorting protein